MYVPERGCPVLGTELRYSARAASVLKGWAISSPTRPFLKACDSLLDSPAALRLVYLLVSHPVSAQQEPCFHLEPWPVCASQRNYPYFLDWLRTLLWSPTKPCSKHSVDPPHCPSTRLKPLECLYLGLLHSTEIYSHLIRVHFSLPDLDYEFSAARKTPSISLWPWTIRRLKTRLFFLPLSIWFLYADSETKDFFGEPSADTSDWWLQL